MSDTATPTEHRQSAFVVGLLGPLEISLDGRSVELPKRKQRLLLTLLLLKQGEVVSRGQLVELVWGDKPPKAAVSSLQNLVSELRKALGSEVVCTHPAGYSIGVDPESIDVHHFERLVAEARADERADGRAQRLHEALALWRGPPLLEFAPEPFARDESARLHELRTVAREDLVDAELELGRHRKIVGELEALVKEQPLRERLRGQLMIALYRSWRQAEALAAYQDIRRLLAVELGLTPSVELRQLERAILTQDRALTPTSYTDSTQTPTKADLTPERFHGRRLPRNPTLAGDGQRRNARKRCHPWPCAARFSNLPNRRR